VLKPKGANLTVDTLLISKGVALLCLVPVNDQAVTERQSCSTVGSATILISNISCPDGCLDQPFIAVVQWASESCLDMTDCCSLPILLELQGLCLLQPLVPRSPPCSWSLRHSTRVSVGSVSRQCSGSVIHVSSS